MCGRGSSNRRVFRGTRIRKAEDSSPSSVENFLCPENFDTFSGAFFRELNMNVVSCEQLILFQILTYIIYI